KDFTLTNPSRIVVDLQGVRSEFGNKTFSVDGGPVERVRVGQPAPNMVRVVIDSKSKLPYNISRQGASLVIAVGDGSTASPTTVRTADLPAASKPAGSAYQSPGAPTNSSSSASKDPAAAKVTPGRTPAVSDSRATDSKASAIATQSVVNAPLANQVKSPVNPAQSDKSLTGLQATVITGSNSVPDATPRQAPNTRPRQKQESVLCDPEYVGGPISFDLRAGVDIRDMLRFISQQYGVNFIVDTSVKAVPVELKIT